MHRGVNQDYFTPVEYLDGGCDFYLENHLMIGI